MILSLSEFLSPLWEFLFEKMGMFGVLIAAASPIIIIGLVIVLIGILVGIIKRIKAAGDKSFRRKARLCEENGNYTEAYRIWRKITEKRKCDAEDYYRIGLLCQKGTEEAWQASEKNASPSWWFKKAASLNHANSQYELGKIMTDQNSAEPLQSAKGIDMIRKAKQSGSDKAEKYLAEIDEKLKGILKNTSYNAILSAAALGNAESQYYIAENLPEKSMSEAMEWYLLSAEQGYRKAQATYGDILCFGKFGVSVNMSKGIEWLTKAAEQGCEISQAKLGFIYAKEEHSFYNEEKAIYWYKQAAEQGLAAAQFNLGLLYGRKGERLKEREKSDDFDIDIKAVGCFYDSIKWIEKAAHNGNPQAIQYLKEEGYNL